MNGTVAKIELPWPPSVNTYWRSVVVRGRSVVLISRAGRVYREAVALAVRQRWPGLRVPTRQRLVVSIVTHAPDRRTRDLDNLPKSILDALTHAGVWVDDGQIDGIAVTRGELMKGGSVEVSIEMAQGRVTHAGWVNH